MSTFTLNRDWLLRGLLALVVAGAVAWLASCTEWVEVEVPIPARGEAAKNDLYVTQQLVRRLGATVATPTSFAELPPPRATLLLNSWYWDLFPERAQRLKAWVEGGGHLVMYAGDINHKQLKAWLPIQRVDPPAKPRKPAASAPAASEDDDEDADEEDDTPAPSAAPASSPGIFKANTPPCQDGHEPDTVPGSYPGPRQPFKVCAWTRFGWTMRATVTPSWLLQGDDGPLAVRAPLGRGQVTALMASNLLSNDRVLRGDNALVAVAALQARPGSDIWFVTEEKRPHLLRWLWQEAWVAVLLAAATLALALWRSARRFGPLAPVTTPGRRSMAEQIAGTAQFLRREGPEALLSAQIRALETVARGHVRHYDKLGRGERALAIAQATGLNAEALGLALDKSLARRRVDLPATLELLETARRLLLQRDPTPRN